MFGDPLSLTIHDNAHSSREERFVIMGQTKSGRVLVVVHTERGNHIRIISARVATKREKISYEEE